MGRMVRHAVPVALRLADAATAADLATFLRRARRADPDGAARLVGHGDVLAVYVSPVHGAGGPVVLGLRTLRLAAPSTLDATVPLDALAEAVVAAAAAPSGPDADTAPGLAVPRDPVTAVAWAGTSPPRSGWQPVTALAAGVLADRASEG